MAVRGSFLHVWEGVGNFCQWILLLLTGFPFFVDFCGGVGVVSSPFSCKPFLFGIKSEMNVNVD